MLKPRLTLTSFYRRYANLPIEKRISTVQMDKIPGTGTMYFDTLTPENLYNKIKKLDDQRIPLQAEIDRLLKIAEKIL